MHKRTREKQKRPAGQGNKLRIRKRRHWRARKASTTRSARVLGRDRERNTDRVREYSS